MICIIIVIPTSTPSYQNHPNPHYLPLLTPQPLPTPSNRKNTQEIR